MTHLYHVTYRSRCDVNTAGGRTFTDRVYADARYSAIQATCWKHPHAVRASVSAVKIPNRRSV